MERSLENVIVESYIQGVSTRRVRSVVESLGIKGISADTVSRMAQDLDQDVKAFWRALFEELKDRGLTGVQLVTSDGHKGIQNAVLEGFPGVSWQICMVHYLRAIMRNIPLKNQDNFRPYLKAALFENNGGLMEIAEDLHYYGYRKASGTIERFLPDIQNYQTFPKPDTRREICHK